MSRPKFQIGEMVDFDSTYHENVNEAAKFAIVTAIKDKLVDITVFLEDGDSYDDIVTPYCIIKR